MPALLAPVRRLARALALRLARPFLGEVRRGLVADLRADLQRLHDPAFYQRLPEALRNDLAALQPLVALLRQEVLAEVREELRRQHDAYLDFHATFTRQVADDLTRLHKALDTHNPARAA